MVSRAFGLLLAVAVVLPASEPASIRRCVTGSELREVLCLAGTGTRCLTSEQSAALAMGVDELMRVRTDNAKSLADFVDVIQAMRHTGVARTLRVFPGRHTLREVCGELGALTAEQQRLQREGRRSEIAGVLCRIHAAQHAGASEAEVQRLARAAVERGDLMVRSGAERQRVERRIELLVRQLVIGEQAVACQASRLGVSPAVLLSELSRTGQGEAVASGH